MSLSNITAASGFSKYAEEKTQFGYQLQSQIYHEKGSEVYLYVIWTESQHHWLSLGRTHIDAHTEINQTLNKNTTATSAQVQNLQKMAKHVHRYRHSLRAP